MNYNFLLIFIPITLGLDWFEASPTLVFMSSGLAIVPLAGLLGKATESLSFFIGETFGGLLAATMGNAPELIISLFALKAGLYDVVKAAITGSIIGNLLLGMGLAIFIGSLDKEKLTFNRISTGMSSGLLMLASVGLIVPAIFHFTTGQEKEFSIQIAVVLFIAYISSLIFTLKTHHYLFQTEVVKPADGHETREKEKLWPKYQSIMILVVVTIGITLMSETLTSAIEPTAESLGFTPIFAGVIFLALFGNIADMANAVRFARKDQMDLAMGISVGASTQVVMFVTPILIFASYFIGPKPLDLYFVPFEVVAIVMAVLINRSLMIDGETHWMEGLMLLGVYLILAIGFFFLAM